MSDEEGAAAAVEESKNDGIEGKGEEEEDNGPRKFLFPSHQSHMVSLAKMCKRNKEYTDCVIQCVSIKGGGGDDDEVDETEIQKLKAHRLVLGAVSPFLKLVFNEVPASLPEATILVPGVKARIVSALIDFLYTGEMTVEREDTGELQRLIETLQIDPSLITVDVVARPDGEKTEEGEEEPSSGGGGCSSSSVTVEKVGEPTTRGSGGGEAAARPTSQAATAAAAAVQIRRVEETSAKRKTGGDEDGGEPSAAKVQRIHREDSG